LHHFSRLSSQAQATAVIYFEINIATFSVLTVRRCMDPAFSFSHFHHTFFFHYFEAAERRHTTLSNKYFILRR